MRASPDVSLEACGFLQEHAGVIDMGPNFRGVSVRDEDGRILAVIGLTGWAGSTATVNVACVNPYALLPAMRLIAKLGVEGLKVTVGLAYVDSARREWLKALAAIGFREVTRIRLGMDGTRDLVLLEIRPESCRFYKRKRRITAMRHVQMEAR